MKKHFKIYRNIYQNKNIKFPNKKIKKRKIKVKNKKAIF